MWSSPGAPGFEFALGGIGAEREEVEAVRVFQQLLGKVGLRRRECGVEVRHRLALAAIQVGLDPVGEHGTRPAVGDGLLGIPKTLVTCFELLQQNNIVPPGNF